MEKIKLIEEINKATENKFGFSLKSATVNRRADFCVLEFWYNDGVILETETKTLVFNKCFELLPKRYDFELKFTKNFVGEDFVTETMEEFLKNNYPAVFSKTKKVMLSGEKQFSIVLLIDILSYEYALKKNVSGLLAEFLQNKFFGYSFDVTLIKNETESIAEIEKVKNDYQKSEADQNSVRKIEVLEPKVLVGKEISFPANYIKDIIEPQENVIVCGKIQLLKSYENKPVISENPEEKKHRACTTFKWVLHGFTGSINCIYFAGKAAKTKLLTLEENQEIVARGNVQTSKFSGELVLMVNDISTCKLPTDFKEQFVFHLEKPFYEFVKPEPVVVYAQDDLLNFAEEKHVPEYLLGRTFVCYDLETTGTHFEEGDKMVEIGAVKIENGKITESFSCLVNPERPISPKASQVNGIYDADVANSYKDYQVLQDFYKFTRGATLIGYNNIMFDNVFLVGQGKNCRWNFEQPTEDVFKYAQKFVHGVKNYKLGTIAAKLGVPLENAHRAVYDATATAEIFIKLAENLKLTEN